MEILLGGLEVCTNLILLLSEVNLTQRCARMTDPQRRSGGL